MKLYMVRHGEPDYAFCDERGFIGHGRDLAPLSSAGIEQAEKTAKDERLKCAELIIASPYTRALQTAAIISRVTGIRLVVEVDLREWQPDLTFQYCSSDECTMLYNDFLMQNGEYPNGETRRWERSEDVKVRALKVLKRYAGKYDKIIMVSHCVTIQTICGKDKIDYAEIIECDI